MSAGAGGGPASMARAYQLALADYVRDPTETTLRVAYELGREAVNRQLSVLELAVIHQEGVSSGLAQISGVAEAQRFTSAAGDFFLESLSSFEMVQRGFKEARRAFLNERRNTELSRRLSTFLADVSLALDASDSLQEVLALVVEQARELVDADCCVATVGVDGQPRIAEAAAHSEDKRWTAFIRWLDLPAVYRLVRLSGGSMRVADEQLARLPVFHTGGGDKGVQGWLAASLTALDGSALGAIQLFDKQGGSFTQDDEAVLVHLAQTASAAIERAQLYQKRS